jgi:pimeloyl-ACP methyl ester carboxylesterase
MTESVGNVGEHHAVPLQENKNNVSIRVETFTPENNADPSTGVILIPGWAMSEKAAPIKNLAHSLSDNFESTVYALTLRSSKITGESIVEEARELVKWVQASGLKRVIFSGHSEGALKAGVATALLEEENDKIDDESKKIEIEACVQLDATGLYQQENLAKDFAKDSLVNTPRNIINTLLGKKVRKEDARIQQRDPKAPLRALSAGNAVIMGLGREAAQSGYEFLSRTQGQIQNMEKLNPYLAQIRSRVIIISGMDDGVSDPHMISPDHLPDKMMPVIQENSPREKDLKERIFKSSSDVKAFYPQRYANHPLPLIRFEQIARVISGLVKRNRSAL